MYAWTALSTPSWMLFWPEAPNIRQRARTSLISFKMFYQDDPNKNIYLVNFPSYSWFKMIETRRFTQLTYLCTCALGWRGWKQGHLLIKFPLSCYWFKRIELNFLRASGSR